MVGDAGEWRSCYWNAELRVLLVVDVEDFKMAGPRSAIAKCWTLLRSGEDGIEMDEPNQVVDSIHQVDLDRSKISRVLWFTTGFIVMTIGLIGIIVPVLPTTPLMILAAACFAKSSQRFYDWIINNKMFGQHVKNYREGNGIPKKSKPIILVTMWTFVLFAVLIAIPDSAPPVSKIATLVLAVIGTIFILRIPNLSQDDS